MSHSRKHDFVNGLLRDLPVASHLLSGGNPKKSVPCYKPPSAGFSKTEMSNRNLLNHTSKKTLI